MGLFGVFRRSKPVEGAPPPAPAGTLSRLGVNDCYGPLFRAEMTSIGLLSSVEIEEALRLICGDDGCENQGRYHRQVFEKFFRDRTGNWPWYDEWDARFKAFGAYPVRWPVFREYSPPRANDVVYRLTVVKLKALMTSAGLEYPLTAKGTALRALALQSSENRAALEQAPLWATLEEAASRPPEGFVQYTMVMRTILFRATCVSKRSRARALGLKGWRPIGTDKQDQRFIDYALSLEPEATTPLYPGDVTVMGTDSPNFAD